MKKITNILIILGVLATAFVATSCGGVNNTYDTWYKYTETIDKLPIANAGTTDKGEVGDGMLKDAQLYLKFNDTDGLTIRVITLTKQTVSFAGGAYEIPDVTVAVGGEKTYSTADFGPVKWELLIRLGSFVKEDPTSTYTDISKALAGQFNLKRILAEFLLKMLQ